MYVFDIVWSAKVTAKEVSKMIATDDGNNGDTDVDDGDHDGHNDGDDANVHLQKSRRDDHHPKISFPRQSSTCLDRRQISPAFHIDETHFMPITRRRQTCFSRLFYFSSTVVLRQPLMLQLHQSRPSSLRMYMRTCGKQRPHVAFIIIATNYQCFSPAMSKY